MRKYLRICKKSSTFAPAFGEKQGELTEWSKVPHSKCGVRITSYRGFESLTLRSKRIGIPTRGVPISFIWN